MLLVISSVACSKRSDSGERCEVKKAMKSRVAWNRLHDVFIACSADSPRNVYSIDIVGLKKV